MILLTGRFPNYDGSGTFDIVKCNDCGKEWNEKKGVNPSKLKCECKNKLGGK